MTKATSFGAVRPDNLRTARPAARRDPDDDNPAAAPAAAPAAPAAVAPVPDPAPAAPPPPVPAPTVPDPAPSALASTGGQPGGGTLASVLAPTPSGNPDSVSVLRSLAAMRNRPVDPMSDWVGDGTRTPRWIKAALSQYAQMTGRQVQDVQRDIMLGQDSIPADFLDANWLDCYGFPRAQYNPQDYR